MAVRHHIKVLVIDDDPSICKTVGLLLEDHGFAPTMFTDPEAAIDSAKKESFQVALVDLRMPAMDGVDVVGSFRGTGVALARDRTRHRDRLRGISPPVVEFPQRLERRPADRLFDVRRRDRHAPGFGCWV